MFELSDARLPGGKGVRVRRTAGLRSTGGGGRAGYSQKGFCFLPLFSSNGQWVSLLCYRGENFRLKFAWDACGPAFLLFRGIDCTMTKREEKISAKDVNKYNYKKAAWTSFNETY